MLSRRAAITSAIGGAVATAVGTPSRAEEIQSLPPILDTYSSPLRASSGVQSANVSVSVADSPLKDALDIFYDFLVNLSKQNGYQSGKDKMLVNNTITSFDISQDTPYFNEELFRAFADRVYKDSPDNIGAANRADRFSLHYEQIIQVAAAAIDRKYPQIIKDVESLQSKLEDQTTKLGNRVNAINKQWSEVAKGMGLTPADPNYELRLIGYLDSIRYADQINQYSLNIDMILGSIDAVRRDPAAYKDSELLILDCLAQLNRTRKIARPRRPNFERTVPNVNEMTFANPQNLSDSIFDISPSAYPLGDLIKFLKVDGVKTLSIGKSFNGTERHDRSWSASGSGKASFFGISIGGGAGGSGSSSYTETISKSAGIDISFSNIAEYLVDRDLWFNPSIFQDAKLSKVLTKIPGYERLQYASVSLIIARGLTLTMKFDTTVDTNSWSKQAFDASGGVSVLGFSFGGSGASSRYDSSVTVSGDRKSVTFKDDPQLVRLLGVRLEPFAILPGGGVASTGPTPLDRLKKGEIDYLQYQKLKF